MNYANKPSQAVLERASQDVYCATAAAAWTADDVARVIE